MFFFLFFTFFMFKRHADDLRTVKNPAYRLRNPAHCNYVIIPGRTWGIKGVSNTIQHDQMKPKKKMGVIGKYAVEMKVTFLCFKLNSSFLRLHWH